MVYFTDWLYRQKQKTFYRCQEDNDLSLNKLNNFVFLYFHLLTYSEETFYNQSIYLENQKEKSYFIKEWTRVRCGTHINCHVLISHQAASFSSELTNRLSSWLACNHLITQLVPLPDSLGPFAMVITYMLFILSV